MLIRTLVAATTLAAAAGLAHAEDYASGAVMATKTPQGDILTDAKGMTLYVFDKDKGGMSSCYADCAKKWPPLLAAKGAKPDGAFTLTKRKDGHMQWAHDGMPLYLWQADMKPGDMTGDGVGGVWHIAKD